MINHDFLNFWSEIWENIWKYEKISSRFVGEPIDFSAIIDSLNHLKQMYKKDKRPRSSAILLVVVCASIGYLVFPNIIKCNLIQYATLPSNLPVQVPDDALKRSVVFYFPVKSKLPVDTAAVKRTPISQKIGVTDDMLFHQNPPFLVWMILISVMLTIAAGSFPVFVGQIIQLYINLELKSRHIKTAIFISLTIATVLIISNVYIPGYFKPPDIVDHFHILLKHGSILKWVEIVTVLLMFPAIILIFLTGLSSDLIDLSINGLNAEDAKKKLEEAVEKFSYLDQTLNSALRILAIVVVFSVLTSGMLGNSINSVLEVKGMKIYPTEVCYIYGMCFTIFLCVIYVPVYMYLKQQNNFLNYAISEVQLPDTDADKKWIEGIKSESSFNSKTFDQVKIIITVLSPLISSFLPGGFDFLK
jgi:hypothetical protein